MVLITISKEDELYAKRVTEKFDSMKTHDKLECGNNWLGFLGELLFSKWLKRNEITYKWHTYLKSDYTQPDFEINGKSLDIKITVDNGLWVQSAKYDYYVLGIVDRQFKEICFCGYIDNIRLKRLLTEKRKVFRGGRIDYKIEIEKLDIMSNFLKKLSL